MDRNSVHTSQKTVCKQQKEQSVNVVWANHGCLLYRSHGTHKHAVWIKWKSS